VSRLAGAIFDLDGTLVDTLPVCFAAFRRAFERLGGPSHSDDAIRALFGPSEEGMMQRVMPDRWEEAVAAYLQEYERHLPMCAAPFPDVVTALDQLRKRGIPIALVTGKGAASTAMSLRYFGFDGLFDVVESGSPRGVVKAEAIRRIVKRWEASSDLVIYVGDAATDMHAAREARVLPIGAAWASTAAFAELEAAHPARTFTTADDFRRWLLEWRENGRAG
jgi:phosphoglycolate phosphatase-like HAD superfamily hydrolase